jgi:hypothetical protein
MYKWKVLTIKIILLCRSSTNVRICSFMVDAAMIGGPWPIYEGVYMAE